MPWVLDPDLIGKSPTNRAKAAIRGDDDRNNTEQVLIHPTETGLYKVQITHKGSALTNTMQEATVVVSGNEALTVPPLFIMDVAQVSSNQLGFLCSTVPGTWYKLQSINDVTASNWADVAVVQASSEQTAATINIPPTNRFYRVRTDP